MELLYTATFGDGTEYKQPPDDKYPNKEGGEDKKASSFKYVLEQSVLRNGLVKFTLTDKRGRTIAVFLNDGHFELNGHPAPIKAVVPKYDGLLEVVYYRSMKMSSENGVLSDPVVDYYAIGWKIVIEGKEYSYILPVKGHEDRVEKRKQDSMLNRTQRLERLAKKDVVVANKKKAR